MRRLSDEQGAGAAIVAVVALALIAMLLVVIDAGLIFYERRQLQNGADAAAFAIGFDCARVLANIPPIEGCNEDTAQGYADANAHDGAAQVVFVSLGASEVTVGTGSQDGPDGPLNLRLIVGPMFGIPDTVVGAQATVQWGAAAVSQGLALALCESIWQEHKSENPPGEEVTIVLRDQPDNPLPEDCEPPPGGFFYLTPNADPDPDNDQAYCDAEWAVGDEIIFSGPGNDTPCEDGSGQNHANKFRLAFLDETVHIPIYEFESAAGGGAGGTYLLLGWAPFHITGYFFNNQYSAGDHGCSSPQNCIRGFFTTANPQPGLVAPDAPNLGVVNVQLVK